MFARQSLSPMKYESTKAPFHGKCDIKEEVEQCNDDDYSDGDDVDDTEDQSRLWLGFIINDQENQSPLHDLCPHKAGGSPAWLDPSHLPSGRSSVCDFCEEPLQFLLQVYAPIYEKDPACHRAIFVFMCPSMACLRQDQHEQQKRSHKGVRRSVKVFRCQLPITNPIYASDSKSSHGNATHLGPKAALCSWCNTWKGDQLCSGCRRVRYCSRDHQIKHWRSGHKDHCKQNTASPTSAESQRASNTLWPEYEIELEPRCKSSSEQCEVNGPLSLVQETDQKMMSMMEFFEGDDDKNCWASFQAHIAKDEDQVLRCWKEDGRPLWPEARGRPSSADIPNCNHCSGPMRFEFQIMPQLLYYIDIENEVDSLDWATIAIYTCEASCDSAPVYKDEFPWVQLWSKSPAMDGCLK